MFQNFERSNIELVRHAVKKNPERYSVFFLLLIAFWTILMSIGAGLNGNNGIALNLTPHVSLFTVTLGIFIYPARLFWIPLLAFLMVFTYPIIQPFVAGAPWYSNAALSPNVLVFFFAINVAASVITASIMRIVFTIGARMFGPHTAQVLVSLSAFFVFMLIGLAQLEATVAMGQGLDALSQQMLGMYQGFESEVFSRLLRGGVVLAAFLIALIEMPNKRQWIWGGLLAFSFPVLAVLQEQGLVLHPMMDTAIFALILVLALPTPITIVGCIIGFPLYAALTGEFLSTVPHSNGAEIQLDYYSSIALFLVALALVFKSRARAILRATRAGVRRLSRMRDFAGLGLFSVNITRKHYHLDSLGAQILGISSEGPLANFLQRFDIKARDNLTDVFSGAHEVNAHSTLALNIAGAGKPQIQVFMWRELSHDGELIAHGLIRSVQEERAPLKLENMSLIIAEDNKIIADLLQARLARQFPDIRMAASGQEMLDIFAQRPAEALIINGSLANKSEGGNLVSKMRKIGFSGAIAVTVSGHDPEQERQLFRAGADDVIKRPFDFERLVACFRASLQQQAS